MATRRLDANKEQSIGQWSGGGTGNNRGSGKDAHLPIGHHTSLDIVWRGQVRFGTDWTDVAQITSAKLYLRVATQVHSGYGSSPRIYARRLTAAFSTGGGGENNWTSGSAEDWPGAASTSTAQVDSGLLDPAESQWEAFDITPLIDAIAPTTVKQSGGAAGAGNTNYGFELRSFDETQTSRMIEFFGYRSSYPPYITLVYTPVAANTAPTKPVATSPVGTTGSTPTFSGTGSDPDVGDTCAGYDLQVSTDQTFASVTHWNLVASTTALSGFNLVNRAYAGTALGVGTYYWRWRNTDNHGAVSPWSDVVSFSVTGVPSVTTTIPGAAGFAPIWNLNDAVLWDGVAAWAKPTFGFTYVHGSGAYMAAYQVLIQTAAGAAFHDTGEIAYSAAPGPRTVNVNKALVLGTEYKFQVRAKDTSGVWSAYSTATTFKVKWGQAVYQYNPGAASSAWSISLGATGGSATQIALFYRSGDDAAMSGASGWFTSIGDVPIKAYLQVAVRLATSVVGQNPTLADVTFRYATASLTPDKWIASGGTVALDSTVRRFGAYSAKAAASTTNLMLQPFRKAAYDGIPVQPNTTYTFSCYARTQGSLGAGRVYLRMYNMAGTVGIPFTKVDPPGDLWPGLSNSSIPGSEDGWYRMSGTFVVPEGTDLIRPALNLYNASGQTVWFDAVQLEEGAVASAWSPGFVGVSGARDTAGIQLDGSEGAIFRLRGSNKGARDTLELGPKGLLLGGDTEITSSVVGQIEANGVPISGGGGGGAPTTADYLVGTAQAGLSAEIVVGTTPGGELGGTWASPTVDASHSGSTHAATQSAAETTAATALSGHAAAADPHTGYQRESEKGIANGYAALDSGILVPIAQLPTGTTGTTVALGNHAHAGVYEPSGAVSTHAGLADPHTGYRLESADHNHLSTGIQAGTIYSLVDGGVLSVDAARIFLAGAAGSGQVYFDSQVGHNFRRSTGGLLWQLDGSGHLLPGQDNVYDIGLTGRRPRTIYARALDVSGTVTGIDATDVGAEASGAVSTHEAAADPHTGYQKESEKGVANGYASLAGAATVPVAQLGTGTPSTSTFLRGDGFWAANVVYTNPSAANQGIIGGAAGIIPLFIRGAASQTANIFQVQSSTPTTFLQVTSAGVVSPGTDNTQNLGASGNRWAQVWAGTGTIQTSDLRDKEWDGDLTEQELRVAKRLARSVGRYRWQEAVDAKGDNARSHVGVSAQEVQAAFEAEGLDATRYGMFCYDEWPETEQDDGEGNMTVIPAGSRYSLRLDEVSLFIAAGQEQRLKALEGG